MQKNISELRNQKDFFDKLIVENWHSYKNDRWDSIRDFEINKIIKKIDTVSIKRVLDLGCGCGYHDKRFAEKLPNVESVIGVDYSEKSVAVANKEYPHPKVTRYVCSLKDVQEEWLDLVISFQVIEHLEEPELLLKKSYKLLKDSGYLIIATPNFDRLNNRVLQLFSKPKQVCDPYHFKEFNLKELTQLGIKYGFQLHTTFGYGLSLNLPKLNKEIIPESLSLHLGYYVKNLSNVICVIFKR